MKTNLIILDTETGGYFYDKNPITEVCLYIVDPITFKVLDKYQTYVKPYDDLKIEPQAIEATQVDMKNVLAGVEVNTMVKMLMMYFKKAKNGAKYGLPQLVGHNVSFDWLFLDYAFAICGKLLLDFLDPIPICTMRMMSLHDAGSKLDKTESASISLTASCERFGIKLKSAHGAENDVIATTALLKAMTSKLRSTSQSTTKEEKVVGEKSRKFFQF